MSKNSIVYRNNTEESDDWLKSLPPGKSEVEISDELCRFYGNEKKRLKGGEGSGNFSHAGRPGKIGGSAPSSGEGRTLVTSKSDPGLYSKIRSWKNGLSNPERLALDEWTRDSRNIRNAQIGKNDTWNEVAKNFEKAMSRGVTFKGTVFRGLRNVPQDVIYDWVMSREISLSNSQSSSSSEETAKGFTDSINASGDVLLRLKQKSGKAIYETVQTGADWGGDPVFSSENEIVLPKGASYTINKILVSYGRGKYVPFNKWFASEVAGNMSLDARSILYRIHGVDKYVERGASLENPYYPLEIGDRYSKQGRAAFRESVEFGLKKRKKIINDMSRGKMPDKRYWPKSIPGIIIDGEEK